MTKLKRKDIIPPLQFVYEPTKKVPYNADYVTCKENYPKVPRIPADDKDHWIEPHFYYSQKCTRVDVAAPKKRQPETSIGPLDFSSTGRKFDIPNSKPAKCPVCTILPPVTPIRSSTFHNVLVVETPHD